MEIIELNNEEIEKFIQSKEHNISHTLEFKQFIESTFKKTKPIYLGLKDKEITTILPLFLTKHILFGKKIISIAFNDYGGFAGDIKEANLIINYIKQKYKDFDSIEIREKSNHFLNYDKEEKFALYELNLTSTDHLWQNLDKKRRNCIKNGEEKGVIVKEINESEINELYNIYLKNMKEFPSPPFSKKFFINFFKIIKNNKAKAFGAYVNNKLVCGLLAYTYKKRIDSIIGVSDYKYLDYKVNDVAYWEFVKWACKNDFKMFSFGRSEKNSGHALYKLKWGCNEKPLTYYFIPLKKKADKLDKNSTKYKIGMKLWKLLPIRVTRIIGPFIREGFGI